MGLFWDLFQQSKLSEHANRADSLDDRVAHLESELDRTQQILRDVIDRLERHVGQDLDADGRVG
jgi:hypothetical protein